MRASALRRSFERVLLAAIVGPAAIVPIVACTGGAGPLEDASPANGGASSRDDSSTGECRAAETVDAATCEAFTIRLAGDLDTCPFDDAGRGNDEFCRSVCGRGWYCTRVGAASVECTDSCPVDGRRYTRLDDSSAPLSHDVGSYLARMAFFEAASIDSFVLLRRELTAHGAPRALIAACSAAGRDEIAHARMATRLARRHGADVVMPPALPLSPPRSLEEIAVENAVEGCVRETFGVLIGMWQAKHAPTKELRAFFAKLVHDESRHAALALRIDAWLRTRLDDEARDRVDAARARALVELEASLDAEPMHGLGLPTRAEAARIFASWTAVSSLAA